MNGSEIMLTLNTETTKLRRTQREIGAGLDGAAGEEGGIKITLELNALDRDGGTFGYATIVKWRFPDGTFSPCQIDWSNACDMSGGDGYSHGERVGAPRTAQFAALLLKAAEIASDLDSPHAYPPSERKPT